MKHLLSTEGLDAAAATAVLDTADSLKRTLLGREVRKLPTLRGRTVVTMFYENSTRTRVSFEVAGKWMSADVINVSAISKETRVDRKSTRLNSSHSQISYAVFCLKNKNEL